MAPLPSGTVTFLFTDVEGSTKLLHELGAAGYAEALSAHRLVVRRGVAEHGGMEVDTQGDAFFCVFPSAQAGVAAALAIAEALAAGPIRVRMGLHTGTPHLTGEGYVGEDVHLGARIAAAGHGGQTLISASTRATAEGDYLDLGEHRLKDFSSPVAIFQVGSRPFPPLRTVSNTNLPRPASTFVGRRTELARLTRLLRGGARLVTLTGAGGSGKTRLAIEAAAALVPEVRAGVFWVGLAALRDPNLVGQEIARTLGAKEELADHIGEREMLILLDNFEQVVDAAPRITALLEACPNLRLLVTSRERLRIRGEAELGVAPLVLTEAVELFCARALLPPSDDVRQLCRRLDNLPLAVELAAARVTLLSPRQIIERLSGVLDVLKGGRDVEARQRTLRATIEWSHGLLNEDEQRLFAAISVFAGGCTLQAAEQVIEADLDVLGSLVDKSLVRQTNGRFWMLETIRAFALEQADAAGRMQVLRDAHAVWVVELATRAQSESDRWVNDPRWYEAFEAERQNIRAALDHLLNGGDVRGALRIERALWNFWISRGHVDEGEQIIRRTLLLAPDDTGPDALVLRNNVGHFARHRGDLALAAATYRGALAVYRHIGEPRMEAAALHDLAGALVSLGELDAAAASADAALAIFEELGDLWGTAQGRDVVADVALARGDAARAGRLWTEAAELMASAGDRWGTAWMLISATEAYRRTGDPDAAARCLRAALEAAGESGDLVLVGYALETAALLAAHIARPREAIALFAAVDRLRKDASYTSSWEAEERSTLERLRIELPAPRFDAARLHGERMGDDEALKLAAAIVAAARPPSARRANRNVRNCADVLTREPLLPFVGQGSQPDTAGGRDMAQVVDAVEIDRALKARHRAMWAMGNYPAVASELVAPLGPILVEAAGIGPGQRVLDIAAGSGNAAIPAALTGADVTASDLTPDLLESGRQRAAAVGAELEWVEADAEALPFADGEFDAVISAIGIMFAPHHQAAADELVRVCRSGGSIGLASWTPEGFVGQMFVAMRPYAPAPPPGAQPAPLWGREDHVRALLGDAVTDVEVQRKNLVVDHFAAPEDFREYFKRNYGPTIAVYRVLADDPERAAALDRDLDDLARRYGIGAGKTQMEWEYLVVTARKRS